MKPKRITLTNVTDVPIHGHQPGEVFHVEADAAGVPVDQLWRKRLADQSVEIVKQPAPAKAAKTSATKEKDA